MAKLVQLMRRLWLEGRLYVGNNLIAYFPSHTVRLAYYRILIKAKIGAGTNIFMRAWLDSPGDLSIGTNTIVNQRCRLDSRGGLTIGNSVSIAAEVCILTATHDMQSRDCAGVIRPVTIEDYVFIGTRAMILPGVTIGRGAVVAAGAVVSRDVDPYTIVAGVPSRIIGHRQQDLEYSASYTRLFH